MLRRKTEAQGPAQPQVPTDPTTGLPSRENLLGWLEASTRAAQADSSRVALTFVELGKFNEVSDTYGPELAEQILSTVGARVAESLAPGQQICRYYGSELAVVTSGVNSVERAEELTHALVEVLSRPVEVGPAQVSTPTAGGVALSDSGYESIQEWVEDAHDALTEARYTGHRAVVVHDEATRNRVDVRITQSRVLKGWHHDEFYLMYQPVVRAADNAIAGFEALLRWRDPGASGTFIQPAGFVHLLEKLGLMVPVGAWVLKEACTQMRSWNEQFADLDHLFVSVNLGARQIAQEGFADTVAAALDESGLPPEHLVVDITEDALRFNKSETWNPVRGVKFLGVRAALDDFGTGESGMTYLRELQVDFLTIHRQFLEGLGQVEEDTAIIRSMVELGRELGIATIAEGIETTEQARLIKEIGPDYLQGYYYGRPELPETTEALLADGPTIEGSEDWKMAYSGMAPPPDEDAAEEGPPDEGASFS